MLEIPLPLRSNFFENSHFFHDPRIVLYANNRYKEFGIFYPFRSSNKRYFRATGFSSTFDSRFIEYLYLNLERTKYDVFIIFFFFFLTFNPHLSLFIPRYFDTRFNKNLSYSRSEKYFIF